MGSPSGIWTAVSGGMAQSQNVDVIANNLANASTAGFKKETPVFKEYLTAVERPPAPNVDVPRTAIKDSEFYHTDGREHAFVNVDRVHTDHGQAGLKMTNAPFDLAIAGPGFFALQGPGGGIQYTRAGDFKVDGQGKLVTTDGDPVLGFTAAATAARAQQQTVPPPPPPVGAQPPGGRAPAALNPFTLGLVAPPGGAVLPPAAPGAAPGAPAPLLQELNFAPFLAEGRKITISPEGEIFAGVESIGNLAVAEFADPVRLQKTTATRFTNPDPTNVPRMADASRINQGFLEMSNVNATAELVNLLKANRMYESNMRAIKTYSEMSAKEANEVGKL